VAIAVLGAVGATVWVNMLGELAKDRHDGAGRGIMLFPQERGKSLPLKL
jgi:hypothetical protein